MRISSHRRESRQKFIKCCQTSFDECSRQCLYLLWVFLCEQRTPFQTIFQQHVFVSALCGSGFAPASGVHHLVMANQAALEFAALPHLSFKSAQNLFIVGAAAEEIPPIAPSNPPGKVARTVAA